MENIITNIVKRFNFVDGQLFLCIINISQRNNCQSIKLKHLIIFVIVKFLCINFVLNNHEMLTYLLVSLIIKANKKLFLIKKTSNIIYLSSFFPQA